MDTVSIVVLPTAARELAKLPRTIARRVGAAIDALASDPRSAGVRKLAGGSGDQWRICIGDCRVLYEIRDTQLLSP